MEFIEAYSDTEERNSVIAEQEADGFTMLHDDFSPDWKPGQEPFGTLTFTDEPRPVSPPTVGFIPSNPSHNPPTRIKHIEDFLESRYP